MITINEVAFIFSMILLILLVISILLYMIIRTSLIIQKVAGDIQHNILYIRSDLNKIIFSKDAITDAEESYKNSLLQKVDDIRTHLDTVIHFDK